MKETASIAILPGDGIGPEVMNEAVLLLQEIEDYDRTFSCEMNEFPWNSAYYLEHGRMMPADGLAQLRSFDAILFGAMGDSSVPDEVTVWDFIMPIRKQFQQYINFRPVKKLEGIRSPLAESEDVDFVIIRENAEGEYSNSGGRLYDHTNEAMAIQNTIMTEKGIRRAADFAFQYAKEHGLPVTSATKSNAVIHSMKFWDEVVQKTAEAFPEIALEKIYVDALAAYFVQRPQSFGVVLASNLFGDILSDLGSALVGGLGISPSGNLNPSGDYPSMFEPVHGSAPDIAGQGIANPIAQIWSAALMLDHLGRKDLHDMVVTAIEKTLAEGYRTKDLGGEHSTKEMGEAIRANVRKQLQEVAV
ncbi:putative tartrate dehydrogenase/decarboxylase [Thalassobacillus devorans]|uniref:D-malate dehydrogenase (decarboxylating) n=1 Tax=Thalassobacillus devorans TaxID=279813 RepID=A0ABQ1NJU5_9BACI|nr:tartrate dehydrogenase [Thalassobacillus devorans]NIK27280.1 tartrate dehydrogenase/decarboxylase/D-malate dehydrogenase [Thalassobacillus devorans]GGC76421.1 putative tartrate dehydrogenase/decarboxylase [Thalassobacillus devorans]